MERKPILILNGIHGAGKTTHGRMLASSSPSEFSYFPEIGGQLRSEVGYNMLKSGVTFDMEVMRRELDRDRDLQTCPNMPVVETWHVGNLAYIMERSPTLTKLAKEALQKQLEIFEPFAVLLTITWDAFKQRATEHIDPEAMDDLIRLCGGIFSNILSIYDEFNVPNSQIPNDVNVEKSFQQLVLNLEEHGITSVASESNDRLFQRLD